MSCQSDELSSLPLLLGCPADDEWFLVGNATGGIGVGGYARRAWADIKRCILSTVLLPYVGVVDRGQPNDPVSGVSTFTNALLVGLGANHNGEIQIVYGEQLKSNFGENQTFDFDPITGTINLDFNGSGETFNPQSTLWVDRNQ